VLKLSSFDVQKIVVQKIGATSEQMEIYSVTEK
jgi:hypothetical protein